MSLASYEFCIHHSSGYMSVTDQPKSVWHTIGRPIRKCKRTQTFS